MDSFRIIGGKKLKGEIIPQGAKNEALQIISATLLSSDKITINNIRDIKDVVESKLGAHSWCLTTKCSLGSTVATTITTATRNDESMGS